MPRAHGRELADFVNFSQRQQSTLTQNYRKNTAVRATEERKIILVALSRVCEVHQLIPTEDLWLLMSASQALTMPRIKKHTLSMVNHHVFRGHADRDKDGTQNSYLLLEDVQPLTAYHL